MTLRSSESPIRLGLGREGGADPCTVVIFGASGDLTRRKLVPALYNLHVDGLLPSAFAAVGVSRGLYFARRIARRCPAQSTS